MSQPMNQDSRGTDDEPERAGIAGRVIFAGALPNAVHQLTLSCLRAVERADVLITSTILHEALQDADVVTKPGCRLVLDTNRPVELEQRHAAEGRTVVRLVEGDPLFEGGIADEASACSLAGHAIEILPGVPTLTAAAGFAGVQLGNCPARLVLVSPGDEQVQLPALGELAVRCELRQVPAVARAALDAGRNDRERTLLTLAGGTFRQETRSGALNDFTKVAVPDEDGEQPVYLFIGDGLAERKPGLDWFETQPLFGWRVLVPRTRQDCSELIERLASYGATAEEVATIAVEPPRNPAQLDKALRGLVDGRYEWIIFTSRHAVNAVFEKISQYGLDSRALSGLRIAAVGQDTTEALTSHGVVPDLHPTDVRTVAGLAAAFPAFDDVLDPINKVFIPRADIATEPLSAGLTELGWDVDDVIAYRTVRAAPPPAPVREAIKTGHFDAVAFTSSTTVRNMVGIAGKPHNLSVIGAIGPATADTCGEHGIRVDTVAAYPGQVQLADALAAFATRRAEELRAAGKPVVRPSQRRRRRSAR
ncbi:Uroporphyrinogen-III synthase HemD [Propionibacterium ruminifibrarum]|uniref:Uroporphyrinogen-III synthase HemD n=2 Tax=Propionibacterium ruminifibrarum TaxID=1962131 RepID=A0A375I3Z2_9ACTN|nr:Uroporphyrinogen-III synthase HemD [Propionibacterium ruminifibrarum]